MGSAAKTRLDRTLRSITGLIFVLLGVLLLTDGPGLRQEFYAVTPDWSGDPVYTRLGDPQLAGRNQVADVLVSQEIFSLRWRGWLLVADRGTYRFSLKADEEAYLRIDGNPIADLQGKTGARSLDVEVMLESGAHPIDVGVAQTRGRSLLEVEWSHSGEEPTPLAGRDLIARQPVRIRASLRQISEGLPAGWYRLVGAALFVGGFLLMAKSLARVSESIRRAFGTWSRRPHMRWWTVAVVLVVLFSGVCILTFPYTSATADGDDVRYMDGALFNKQMGWNMNRYAHIYILKGFIELARGDVFLASRLEWSFMWAAVVVALTVAVWALGSGTQLRTLAVVLFLMLAQPRLLGGIGAAYADYTAMMFVTLGLAVYMHGYATQPSSSSRWHALILGALTIGAAKSKEPGAIMMWFAFLMLWSGGKVDLRRFGRRILWWGTGALAAYLLLMTLDAVILGDFWFSLRPKSFAGAAKLLDAAEGKWQLSRWAWLQLPWSSGPLRGLSVVVVLAAITSAVKRRPMELRLVALMPLAFMAMMIAVHPPTLTPRYLFSIIPTACFVGGMMLHDLGLGAEKWRGVISFRTVTILIALVALFGSGFRDTQSALRRHTAYQRGELTLYPWRMFEEQIHDERPEKIVVTDRLFRKYQMIGKRKTRDRIARMFFHRRHLRLLERMDLPPGPIVAVGDRADYRRWQEGRGGLQVRADFDPSRQIALVQTE